LKTAIASTSAPGGGRGKGNHTSNRPSFDEAKRRNDGERDNNKLTEEEEKKALEKEKPSAGKGWGRIDKKSFRREKLRGHAKKVKRKDSRSQRDLPMEWGNRAPKADRVMWEADLRGKTNCSPEINHCQMIV